MFTFRSKLIFLLLTLFMCGTSMGQQRQDILAPKVFKNARDETLLYRLFVPANYDRKKKYPLVLYLHGGGGRGQDNLKQIEGGNGYLIDFFTQAETQSRYPSFVVAPQSPMHEGWIEYDSITPTRQLRLVFELLRDCSAAMASTATADVFMSRVNRWAALAPLRSFLNIRNCLRPVLLFAEAATKPKRPVLSKHRSGLFTAREMKR